MFAKCFRSVLIKRHSVNAAKKLFSTRPLDAKIIAILQSSNQGRFIKASARSFTISHPGLDLKNVAQEDDMRAEDAGQWTKVTDSTDEVKGDFKNFRVSEKMAMKLKKQGIMRFFPVQSNTFDVIYDEFDVIVQARTGSGKTMSYAIPLVEKLLSKGASNSKYPRMLVLTPTRELANQVAGVIKSITDELNVVPLYGGASISNQEYQLNRGVDIVAGTPGRIIDLIQRGSLNLSQLNHVVLDEVDRMLDMGFSDDVDKILKNRYRADKRDENPQTLLFSATVPSWVRNTAKKYLSRDLKMIDLVGQQTNRTSESIHHKAIMYDTNKVKVIADILGEADSLNKNQATRHNMHKTLIFCQTKREVEQLANSNLLKNHVGILHGDVTQAMRENTLRRFEKGQLHCLVATDVAARGLDLSSVDLVIQCSPPQDVDSYIHRSGRTGRAEQKGTSILLYTSEEQEQVEKIEEVAGFNFEKKVFKKNMGVVMENLKMSLQNIRESTKMTFDKLAKELVEKSGPIDVVAAALAVAAGYEQKSLINFKPGFVTLKLTSDTTVFSLDKALKLLPTMLANEASNIKFCHDRKGFVFDVPMLVEKKYMESSNHDNNISVLEVLPRLALENKHNSFNSEKFYLPGRSNFGGPRVARFTGKYDQRPGIHGNKTITHKRMPEYTKWGNED